MNLITKLKNILTELKCCYFWRCVIAEFISSTLYCYIANTSNLKLYRNDKNNPQNVHWEDSAELLNVSLTLGFSTAIISFIFQITEGGYINPAVTLGCFASWRTSFTKTFAYLLMQFIGGIVGTAIVYGICEEKHRTNLELPFSITSTWKGFAVETLLTFIIVMVVLSATDKNKKENGQIGSVVYGLEVTMSNIIGVQYTECAINPATVLGLVVILNRWPNYIWIYWAGPITGGIIAGLFYSVMFSIQTPLKKTSVMTAYLVERSPRNDIFPIATKRKIVTRSRKQ